MIYQREIPVKYETDIFIAGGGAAGVAAAIAAARSGRKVFLAEASGCFGGLGTSGLVPSFAVFGDGEKLIASGIGLDIRKKVSRDYPLETEWTPIDAEELKRVYDEELTASGADFSFFTTLCDVVVHDGHVESVILTSKSGLFAVKAKIYIDCTGDGDLCAFGGGKYELGDENGDTMAPTLCTLWTGIDPGRKRMPCNAYVTEALRDGVLPYEDRHISGFFERKDGIAGGNIGHTFGVDPTDERSLTCGMIEGRASMQDYKKYFRTYFPGFEDLTLCATAPVLGVRESRRIVCDYTLCKNDFLRRAVFEDEIGRYCYQVDIHEKKPGSAEYARFCEEYASLRYKKGESYGIPYRCLVPVSFTNVLVAGRCIGSDGAMQGSVRVMPGCFLTGQAAGAAASLCCDTEDVRKVPFPALADALQSLGAYLPNAR